MFSHTQFSWFRKGSVLQLFGELEKDVLNPLWRKRTKVMKGIKIINLSGLWYIDTAGVALLVHLVETGKKQGERVILSEVSENFLSLVRLYNLPNDLLPYQIVHYTGL